LVRVKHQTWGIFAVILARSYLSVNGNTAMGLWAEIKIVTEKKSI
jgi:hypothetical protein